jgi:Tfp pilus assembly protein PilF
MSVLLLASAALALAPRIPLVLNVNAKEGEVVSGERAFRVSVNSDTAISRVEFMVNGEVRDSDDSTPYEFKFDTVAENDGPAKITFKAYTVESKSGAKTLNVKIDNEVAKGAAYHVEKANALLTDGKYAEARDQGKIALKAEKGNPDARMVLARAYIGLGEYDQAQLQAEEAKAARPEDTGILTVVAGINVQRAFRTYAKPDSDRAEVLKTIKDALAAAVDARRQALDKDLEVAKKDNPAVYADTALRARRYSAAIAFLTPIFTLDQKNAALAERLAYAQIRSNRRQDALNTLNTLQRTAGSLSAYGYALKASALADGGDDAGSDDAIREAVLADSEDLGVRTAQAFIALKRGKTDVLSRLSADLAKEQGGRPDVRYFQMALAAREQRYNDATKAFQVGVLAEPAMADLYVEYANDALAITQRSQGRPAVPAKEGSDAPATPAVAGMDAKEKAQHYAEARAYFEVALMARPEASEALSGLALVSVFENKPADAVKYAQAAVAAAPQAAGAYYALAAAQSLARNVAAAQNANNRAGSLDAKYLGGRQIPDAPAVWRYQNTAGRPTVLAAPAPVAPGAG